LKQARAIASWARFAAFAVGLAGVLWSSAARAATEVVLIEPDPNDPALRLALTRLRSELVATGFDVVTGPGPDHDPRWELEQASGPGTQVTITLRRSRDGKGVDVWVLDRLSGKTLIRYVSESLDSPNAPKIVAVRTVELLRASMLELTVDPPVTSTPRRPLPAPLDRLMARPPTPLFGSFHASLGVGGFVSAGLPFTVLPTLRVGHGIVPRLSLRLSMAAAVAPAEASAARGTAMLAQQFASIDVVGALFATKTLVPFASLGVGVQHLAVTGSNVQPPYGSADESRFTFALDAGLGVAARIGSHFAVLLDARAVTTFPRLRVYVADEAIGIVGAPTWVFGLHALVSL
jgi:hypothetical protein